MKKFTIKGKKKNNFIGIMGVIGNRSRVLQILSFAAVTLVMLIVCVGGILLNRRESAREQSADRQEKSRMMISTQAVLNEEYESRSFVGEPAPEYTGSQKKTISVVEVIPHEACSIFPYLIDWKTEEDYNRNTPLGYEGITISMFKGFTNNHLGDYSMFSLVPKGVKRQYLTDYDVTFTNPYNSGNSTELGWWRESETETGVTTTGYFEYVGGDRGLYAIDLHTTLENEAAGKGIRYQTEALERTGAQSPQGHWDVNAPLYFWGRDYALSSYPDTEVNSRTGFNYDLRFEVNETDGTGDYKIKTITGITGGTGTYCKYEYEAYLSDTAVNYTGNFEYKAAGNYTLTAQAVSPRGLASLTTEQQKKCYVRKSDSRNSDGLRKDQNGNTIDTGYFEKYNPTSHGNPTTVYLLTFTHCKVGQGRYTLIESDVQDTIRKTGVAAYQEILFEYAGENKGTFDLTMIYVPDTESYSGCKYSVSIEKVTDAEGRYALTSAETEENLYIQQTGDYGKVVQKIDCNGLDYPTSTNGNCFDGGAYPVGVSMGMNMYHKEIEYGGWVFRQASALSEMKKTQIEDITNPQIGDRIYVTNQRRYVRYYCRNSLVNNEWFKLLIYMNDPDQEDRPFSESAYYSFSKKGQENVAAARKYLDQFDSNYRVEIIQRTPSQLTVEEVKNADLIFISESEGLNGSIQNWDAISEALQKETGETLPPLPSRTERVNRFIQFEDDFSDEVLLTIYDKCLYTQDAALMMNVDIRNHYSHMENLYTKDNIGKLYYLADLFEDPQDWAQFIAANPDGEPYEERNEAYTEVMPDASLLAYKEHNNYYNLGKINDLVIPEIENTEEIVENWYHTYFAVYERKYEPLWSEWPFSYSLSNGVNGDFTGDGKSHRGKVFEGQSLYVTVEDVAGLFKNANEMKKIWQILNNRNKKKNDLVVEILNGDLTQGSAGVRVIYADPYNPDSFDIDYQITTFPASAVGAALTQAQLTMEDTGYTETHTGPSYQTEDTFSVRDAFLKPGSTQLMEGVVMKKATITAEDVNGRKASAEVWIVLREAFDLH